MSSVDCDTIVVGSPRRRARTSSCVGQIVEISGDGRVFVDFPGNPGGPVAARHALDGLSADFCRGLSGGCPAVLFFENGDARLPIVVGVVQDRIQPRRENQKGPDDAERGREVVVDGKKIVLEAREELVLRCGKGSITLRSDGKIAVKGMHLVSQAAGTNRIKGGSVAIN